MNKTPLVALALLGAVSVTALAQPAPAASAYSAAALGDAQFPYGGPTFLGMARDSYRTMDFSGPAFTAWMEQGYRKAGVPLGSGKAKTLSAALEARRLAIQKATGPQRDQLAQDSAQWAHTFIKKIIPKFSLERGYEFASAIKTGERQCLLQSVLIASLLQKMGLDAGAVMVWQNQNAQESNLGHVVATLRLPSGQAMLLDDASDPHPFMTHQGLLVRQGKDYFFVHPVYSGSRITAFDRADGQGQISLKQMRSLELSYLKSQFNYYRGERVDGGFMGAGGTGNNKTTATGLAQSAKYLQAAVADNPQNALATYVLGLVERKQGQTDLAKQHIQAGVKLYQAQGHLPAGPADALKWAQSN